VSTGYNLVKIKLQNTETKFTHASPLVVSLDPITGSDASWLRVAIVVDRFTGVGNATITLEQSHDAGATWSTVPYTSTTLISGLGSYIIETTSATKPLSPNVRLKIVPDSGVTVGASAVYKTFSAGQIIPYVAGSGSGGAGDASEATLQTVAKETTLQKIRAWPYAAWDSRVRVSTLTAETTEYRSGGISGTIMGVKVIQFTDSTKAEWASITYNPQQVT
jgi:hypothetical protein